MSSSSGKLQMDLAHGVGVSNVAGAAIFSPA
jgi:hypothetical protein